MALSDLPRAFPETIWSWLMLDAEDNDPSRFAAALAVSLANAGITIEEDWRRLRLCYCAGLRPPRDLIIGTKHRLWAGRTTAPNLIYDSSGGLMSKVVNCRDVGL
jgi:hypothetical protein